MKVVLALLLLAVFVFCAETKLANRPSWAVRPPWHTPYPSDDVESDAEFIKSVWKKVGPIAKELGKNYLRSKGIPLQDEDEADFSLPSWVNWGNAQKAINIYQALRRDEEDDDEEADIAWLPIISLAAQYGPKVYDMIKNRRDNVESDFRLPSWVNWENAQKAIDVYNQLRRDEADEESDAEFIKSVWKKVGPIAKELGKNYLRSKGIPLSDSEFSFKKVFKKVVPVLKTVGKMYLRTQGIPLADADSQFFKDWMKKAGNWLKNPENLQKAVDIYRTVRSDEADEEESENPWLWGARAFAWVMKPKPAYDNVEEADQNNFNFGANVNNGQWGVNGQYQRQWNGGNTNLGVQGSWQQGQGYNAGVNFSHRWDDAEESDQWRMPRCICNSPFGCPC